LGFAACGAEDRVEFFTFNMVWVNIKKLNRNKQAPASYYKTRRFGPDSQPLSATLQYVEISRL
jgi:hypothetical protein